MSVLIASQAYAIDILEKEKKRLSDEISKCSKYQIFDKNLKTLKQAALGQLISCFKMTPQALYTHIQQCQPDLLEEYRWGQALKHENATYPDNEKYFNLILDYFQAQFPKEYTQMVFSILTSQISQTIQILRIQDIPSHIRQRDSAIKEILNKMGALAADGKNTSKKQQGLTCLIGLLTNPEHYTQSVAGIIRIFKNDYKEDYNNATAGVISTETKTLLSILEEQYQAVPVDKKSINSRYV